MANAMHVFQITALAVSKYSIQMITVLGFPTSAGWVFNKESLGRLVQSQKAIILLPSSNFHTTFFSCKM